MNAIAHNSAFAKKAGVPQSVGKDFSAADKGKKFAGGGAATQKINRQDTQHGAMDMPFKSLKKFTGMKSGGSVKKYAEGGDLERLGEPQNFKDAFKEARGEGASTFTWQGKKFSTALAPAKKDTTSDTREAGRYATFGKAPEVATEEDIAIGKANEANMDREARRERIMQGAAMGMGAAGAAGAARGVARMIASRGMGRGASQAMDKAAAGTQRQVGPVRKGMERVEEREASATAARKEAAQDRAYDANRSLDMKDGYLKGGSVKKSMGMSSASAAEMMARRLGAKPRPMAPGMKKGGMPMKDGKPAFMMGKKMNMGGMAKYAKGGGIESRGKTKGTVIRMAAGGSVSSASRRGDGIAQRGKTRG
jgi:hypothetical protein